MPSGRCGEMAVVKYFHMAWKGYCYPAFALYNLEIWCNVRTPTKERWNHTGGARFSSDATSPELKV